jgi:hypothetical protein
MCGFEQEQSDAERDHDQADAGQTRHDDAQRKARQGSDAAGNDQAADRLGPAATRK